jgi:hypothetical protein
MTTEKSLKQPDISIVEHFRRATILGETGKGRDWIKNNCSEAIVYADLVGYQIDRELISIYMQAMIGEGLIVEVK